MGLDVARDPHPAEMPGGGFLFLNFSRIKRHFDII